MKRVGAHVSAAGGVQNAPINARAIGARAFALFTRNQRRWHFKPLTQKQIDDFQTNMKEAGYAHEHVIPHDSYLINLGHPEKEPRAKSLTAFLDEMGRCAQLGLRMINFHPGSHLRAIDEDTCLDIIAATLDEAHAKVADVVTVMETTAGQGSNLGYRFEHLAEVIKRVQDPSRMGVCIDTCHIFAAGYDIRTEETYRDTMAKFADIVGFEYLFGMHLNDSKTDLGSRVDRHNRIGEGFIGAKAFQQIMNDPRMDEIPMVLETPNSERWDEEIQMLLDFQEAS